MRRKEPITLTDVAQAAQVSQATVSRVLNKHPRISSHTRRRVLDTISALGYDASPIERKVMAREGKSPTVEFLLCPLAEQANMLSLTYFSQVFEGVRGWFQRNGTFDLRLCTWRRDEDDDGLLRRLELADAVLVMGAPEDALLDELVARKTRTVLIACGRENLPLDEVGSDNTALGIAAARYLLDRGFRRIGMFDFPGVDEWCQRRDGAMAETIRRAGARAFAVRAPASTTLASIVACARDWLAADDFPDALILPYAGALPAVEMALHERGRSCPEDLSVISLDDGLNESFRVVPARFDTYPARIGAKAAQRLAQLLEHPGETPHRISVPFGFIEGNSVRPSREAGL